MTRNIRNGTRCLWLSPMKTNNKYSKQKEAARKERSNGPQSLTSIYMYMHTHSVWFKSLSCSMETKDYILATTSHQNRKGGSGGRKRKSLVTSRGMQTSLFRVADPVHTAAADCCNTNSRTATSQITAPLCYGVPFRKISYGVIT